MDRHLHRYGASLAGDGGIQNPVGTFFPVHHLSLFPVHDDELVFTGVGQQACIEQQLPFTVVHAGESHCFYGVPATHQLTIATKSHHLVAVCKRAYHIQ